MHSGLTNREDAIERKFQHDSELAFKIRARRNRFFGFWAGKQLGLTGFELESYATRIVIFAVQFPGDDALIDMVHQDFQDKKISFSPHQLLKQLAYFHTDAKKELAQSLAG